MAASLALSVDRSSDVPVGAQLAAQLRDAVRGGTLAPGDLLPSVRALAGQAGVNVNTARAVYHRLENEGIVRSEQGRGTFVLTRGNEAAVRRQLHEEIAALESRLVYRSTLGADSPDRRSPGGRLLSTAELTAVRNALDERLRELDAERAELKLRIARLREADAQQPDGARASSPSRPAARVRWVGG
ncbi:MAG TPA: GntR family transcriptional regulator [Thermoleophilaceae bacterium]|nr:GntR family transcriptional regulator [Thermoleophilaceae bacterium]